MNALEIKKHRKEMKMKQEDLAKMLGVSIKTISNYENGEVIPETKKELLLKVFNKESNNIIEESSSNYDNEGNPIDIIKSLNKKIQLKDKIIELLLEEIERIKKAPQTDQVE